MWGMTGIGRRTSPEAEIFQTWEKQVISVILLDPSALMRGYKLLIAFWDTITKCSKRVLFRICKMYDDRLHSRGV